MPVGRMLAGSESGAILPGTQFPQRPLGHSVKKDICSGSLNALLQLTPRLVCLAMFLLGISSARLMRCNCNNNNKLRQQMMAGPPVDHEALLLLLADWGLSSEVLRQVREQIPVVASPVKKPPPNTKRLTAIKNKLNHLRMQHDRMVATYEREMEAARLTGVKITANEKEISDLDAEYRALAEQTRLTPTPTPVATPVATPPGSDNGEDAAEGGEGASAADEFGAGHDDDMGVNVSSDTITQTALNTQNGKKRCVPIPTPNSLNVNFGQYDQEELVLLRQRLDEHLRDAENARNIDLDMAASVALLSGDTGDGFEIAQEG